VREKMSLKNARQNFKSDEFGQVIFIDADEYNYNLVCQPKNIVVIYTQKPCEDDKQLRADICASVRQGQGIGERGWYVNQVF